MYPKISIIVPVYKVEPFIHKCVDSVLLQTFTDFELILVDDGSPDNCGKICDEYAQKDKRVKVIHKENGGLSDARNAGLDIATGDYIGFVDSDDWIESDMFEMLYNMCVENDCEIANCTSIIHYSHKTVTNGGHQLIIHDKKEAMKVMLEGKLYDEVVWTKIFKRDLLKDIRFKTGIIYEDTAFTYKVIHESSRICCIGEPKYHYIKRENSTMDRAIKNVKIDSVLVYDEMYKFIDNYYPELRNLVALKLANSAMTVLNLIAAKQNWKEYSEEYYRIASILNRYFKKNMKTKEYLNTVKILLIATKIHPIFYKVIVNLVSRRKAI
ncbi:glycosyltransferase [Metabacillus halosaccharovorans]|uniref:Glycosyltransferase n=1 Tax=Metabacillus halosaccharovorans TaxID=930124 RepID=A0ABT3DD90_9BACI|nr:glycosyltransferase [Metabacillus halosaccharovorans]MCV9884798.1 glycosyltransferase [Metabacillus halosaccharovorans]